MKKTAQGKTEQNYRIFLYLFILHFFNCMFFDFLATVYAFLIKTPLTLPSLSPVSTTIWLFITSMIFLKILHIFGYEKMNVGLLSLYYLLMYGTGVYVVGNSVQIKLWLIGYKDALGLGLPYTSELQTVHTMIQPVFKLLYLYDEYLGHFLLYSGYFLFFIVFYYSGFTEKKSEKNQDRFKQHFFLFYTSVILNGLVMAWMIIEGQSILLFSLFSALMLGIKIYKHRLASVTDGFGKQIEDMFLLSWVYIFVWFASVGRFQSLPQFFETVVKYWGIY